MKAATRPAQQQQQSQAISIHAAREGGDDNLALCDIGRGQFQSTPPVKAATLSASQFCVKRETFQSTPPVKAATADSGVVRALRVISIHAAREGGDFCAFSTFASISAFQSTPPVKAATVSFSFLSCRYTISIHAAREGGDFIGIFCAAVLGISIHAAREGGDVPILRTCPLQRYFNPRRP